MIRRLVRIGLALVVVVVAYFAVTFVQVWWATHRDDRGPSQAIVVLGAAQYNGHPSPVLRARLDHAYDLWRAHVAPVIVVTGGRIPGDTFTEASVGATYLDERGVPDSAILRETQGRSSWESLAASARFLEARGIHRVTLVSDPFHNARISGIASELGLDPLVSPTRTSPIRGAAVWRRIANETLRVGVGRILGYRSLTRIEHAGRVVPGIR
jgi:uncharacterized SAM-binding protein YcdF (DUF218 family)